MPLHQYFDIVFRAAASTLHALKNDEEQLRGSDPPGTTAYVKNLQATRLQKPIFAVGMFSILEAVLQDRLRCADGFKEARRCLDVRGETALAERFSQFYAAINVLKHGKGDSYNRLLKAASLPFQIERPGAPLFAEGDLTDLSMLVDVDDQFILDCAQLIRDVSAVVQAVHPDAFL
jgi:hypothetical protein